MRTKSVVILLALLMPSAVFGQAARVARTRSGDTTIVMTTGTGVWGPVHDAVEVKRINADSKESTFGRVVAITATSDGGVVLYDAKSLDGPIIRQFDKDGRFVRNLGRQGSGPGEYEAGSSSLVITSRRDGSVVVRERARVVMRFGPDGAYREGFMLHRLSKTSVSNEIVAANDGTFWARAGHTPTREGLSPSQPPMIQFDGSGTVLDSIVEGRGWLAAAKAPPNAFEIWLVIPDGRVLHSRTDKVGVLLTDPKRVIRPIIMEVAAAPIPYLATERNELQDLEDARHAHRSSGTSSPRRDIPQVKPLAHGAFVDVDGRIWVARPGPGHNGPPRIVAQYGSSMHSVSYRDQTIYVAFQPDGTLLGEVRFPPGVSPSFVGNTAWAIVYDADNTPILAKHRIY